MRSRLQYLLGLFLMAAGIATPAAAQPRTIEVPATARWQHARSGVVIPVRIDDLQRRSISENIPGEVDVMVQFADETTRLTVYLFRPQQNDVGLWFDRAEQVLQANSAFGTVTPLSDGPTAFALPISPTASALRRTYETGGQWRSTSLAVAPSGRWLVKVRVSSTTLDPAALDSLIDRAFASIRLPADAIASPEARIIRPCPTPMAWRRARALTPDLADALMASLGAVATTAAMRGEADDNADVPDRPYGLALPDLCRDAADLGANAAYRSPSESGIYWVVLGDSGSYAIIAPPVFSDRADERGVTVATPTNLLIFRKFNRMPSPEQVVEMVTQTNPSAATGFDPEAEAARQAPPAAAPPSS
jgi:hypothetical protein